MRVCSCSRKGWAVRKDKGDLKMYIWNWCEWKWKQVRRDEEELEPVGLRVKGVERREKALGSYWVFRKLQDEIYINVWEEKGLWIGNTTLKRGNNHRYTWMNGNSAQKPLMDYLLIDVKKDRPAHVNVLRGSAGLLSIHYLVVAKVWMCEKKDP